MFRESGYIQLRFGSSSLRDISRRVNDGGLNRVVANATGTGFSLEKHAIGWDHVDPTTRSSRGKQLGAPIAFVLSGSAT